MIEFTQIIEMNLKLKLIYLSYINTICLIVVYICGSTPLHYLWYIYTRLCDISSFFYNKNIQETIHDTIYYITYDTYNVKYG